MISHGCRRPLRRRSVPAADAPGTVVVHVASTCRACHRHGPGPRPSSLTDDELAEDVEWIVDWDTGPSVAARVGYRTVEGLVERLRRAGRADLGRRLISAQGGWA